MPIITSMKPQKNGKRVNIYLDGKFGFGIDLENFVKLGLKPKQELGEKEIESITQKADFQKVSDKLISFATLRPRSEKEIELWLLRKKVEKTFHKYLWSKLKRLELVDDEKFAKWWVEQRLEFKLKSKRELEQELKLKGINNEIIDEVIDASKLDEKETANKLLEKKIYKWKGLPKERARQKMDEYLSRKGFSWETINKILKIREV